MGLLTLSGGHRTTPARRNAHRTRIKNCRTDRSNFVTAVDEYCTGGAEICVSVIILYRTIKGNINRVLHDELAAVEAANKSLRFYGSLPCTQYHAQKVIFEREENILK